MTQKQWADMSRQDVIAFLQRAARECDSESEIHARLNGIGHPDGRRASITITSRDPATQKPHFEIKIFGPDGMAIHLP